MFVNSFLSEGCIHQYCVPSKIALYKNFFDVWFHWEIKDISYIKSLRELYIYIRESIKGIMYLLENPLKELYSLLKYTRQL